MLAISEYYTNLDLIQYFAWNKVFSLKDKYVQLREKHNLIQIISSRVDYEITF